MHRVPPLQSAIADLCRRILGENLVGVYIHGSLAFGCFTWQHSDVDFLIVTHREPSLSEKEALIQALLQLDALAPQKGLEMSGLLLSDCLHPRHPLPFWLHFSNAHKARAAENLTAYCQTMHGLDPDLAAHLTVTRSVGYPITGAPVAEVFAPIPRAAYLDSILQDVSDAAQDIHDNPVYIILNLCRVLAAARENLVLSKAQGGAWALDHVPAQHHPLIQRALNSYTAQAAYTPSPQEEDAFAAWMLDQIQ